MWNFLNRGCKTKHAEDYIAIRHQFVDVCIGDMDDATFANWLDSEIADLNRAAAR
jgi:hypothetical protein